MKRIFFVFSVACLLWSCQPQRIAITVKNPSAFPRKQLVEIPLKKLPLPMQKSPELILTDANGSELSWQKTSDGEFLFWAEFQPYQTLDFQLKKGTPKEFRTLVAGRQYPERMDDFAWENDRMGYRNRPLTKEQKSDNRKKSKTRCLVEHVFGFEEQTMRGLVVRTVGLIRAKANVALTSLVYNISRYTQIIRLKPELLG